MWFLAVFAAALAAGLSRRLRGRAPYLAATAAVGVIVLYAGLSTHAL